MSTKAPYLMSSSEVALELNVDIKKGLSTDEVALRRAKYGTNEIGESIKINPFAVFFKQFKDFLIRILIAAGLASILIGVVQGPLGRDDLLDGVLILAIVVLVALVGFFNEYKAEKTIAALKKMLSHQAKVIRDGDEDLIDTRELVPGDIVILEEGEKVPADIRLLEVFGLQVSEAILTGESKPIFKVAELKIEHASLGDRKNMAYAGTTINSGKAMGIVVATGKITEIGRIAKLVEETESDATPMQKKLDRLGKTLGRGILYICGGLFLVLLFFVRDISSMNAADRLIAAFIAATALAVAAIPEGLAFVVRISLALGARRMAKRNALLRSLPAVEALGSTDVIASDKTGTLTKGEMTVREIWVPGKTYKISGTGFSAEGEFSENGEPVKDFKEIHELLLVSVLCNNAEYNEKKSLGDPTEGALLVAARKAGMDFEKIQPEYERVFEIPFTSERKMMSTVHKSAKGYMVAAKGASEILLQHASKVIENGEIKPLTPERRGRLLVETNTMSQSALRVLMFAYKEIAEASEDPAAIESDLIVVGLAGMMDPPRPEIKETIEKITRQAGIKVIMITGDHIETAKAVAKEIGIGGEAITGDEFDKLSMAEFENRVERISVYARLNPEHKLRIVEALKARGHQVAMTGDGVNDAPAIKKADIGVAMGLTGTDVAKETADVILLDDNFLSIVNAVEEGRGVFDNIRKFVNYLISANTAEVLIVLLGSVIFGRLILNALQLLWINIVTDGLPAIALGSDRAEKNIMEHKPQKFQRNIVSKRLWIEIFVFGAAMSSAVLAIFAINMRTSFEHATAVAFTATVVLEMVRLIGVRSDYKLKWNSNLWLIGAVLTTITAQVLVDRFALFGNRFRSAGVDLADLGLILIAGVILFILMKAAKIILDKIYPQEAS